MTPTRGSTGEPAMRKSCGTEVTAMDVTPVSAIGSGRGSQRAQIARDNDDYDRAVRIARQFRDAEADRRRRQQPPPPRKPAMDDTDELEDELDSDGPRAGAELDTYL
jgi:hypothetical protein